jgi:hypothetical protein
MKKITLIITVLVFSAFITSTYADNNNGEVPNTVTISGKVIDKASQEALAGALIKIDGLEKEVYTDLDGNFSISGISPDTYKIKCTMISYSEQEEEIVIDEKVKNLEIQLQNYSAR